jgi:hypothetical protein
LEPHPIRFAGSKSDADVFRTGCPVSKVAPPPPLFEVKTERPGDGNFVSFGSFVQLTMSTADHRPLIYKKGTLSTFTEILI